MKFSRRIPLDHQSSVHDCQIDYYGKLIATSSADGTVKIKTLSSQENDPSTVAELKGHESHVWALAWAHPAFGTILASGSFDSTVLVWAQSDTTFECIHQNTIHSSSVNSLSWAPQALGPRLLSASSDGHVGETVHDGRTWKDSLLEAKHSMGCLCVQWYPSIVTLNGATWGVIGSGGCDAKVKLWLYSPHQSACFSLLTLSCHDWIRDIAFDYARGSATTMTLAAAVQDKKILIAQIEMDQLEKHVGSSEHEIHYEKHLISVDEVPWKLAWSPHASILHIVTVGGVYAYDLPSRELKCVHKKEN